LITTTLNEKQLASANKIFESPDGGKTVYSREIGKTDRMLHSMDAELRQYLDNMKEEALWKEIFEEAKTNKVLQEAIYRVKLVYHLGKEDGTK